MLSSKVKVDVRNSMPLQGNAAENFSDDDNNSNDRSPAAITLGSGGIFKKVVSAISKTEQQDDEQNRRICVQSINLDINNMNGEAGRSHRSLFSPRSNKCDSKVIKKYLEKRQEKDEKSNVTFPGYDTQK